MTLAEAGVKVLVVEAGPDLSAKEALGGEPSNSLRRAEGLLSGRHRLQAQHPGYWKQNPALYADERAFPYQTPEDQPFLWTQGRQVGDAASPGVASRCGCRTTNSRLLITMGMARTGRSVTTI